MGYINKDLGYYEGDRISVDDEEVENKPSENHTYLNGEWALDSEKLKSSIQLNIDSLESSLYMTRGEREGWIAMILAQASAQNVSEPILYQANPFYKKLKDVNTTVTQLRAGLKAL